MKSYLEYMKFVRHVILSLKMNSNTQLKYTIHASHLKRFFDYLGESLNILSRHNVRHDDIALRNILVSPTEEEKHAKCLTSTLPILIDFEHASCNSTNSYAENMRDFCDLFACCFHTIDIYRDAKLMRWIEKIVSASSDQDIAELQFLRKLETRSIKDENLVKFQTKPFSELIEFLGVSYAKG